jgi:hypothetical protein
LNLRLDGPQRCPECGASVRTDLFPAFARAPAAGSAGAIAVEGQAVCFQHPSRQAVLACDACGRLACALCDLSLDGVHYCPGCFDAARRGGEGELPASRVLYGRSALFLACIPLFPPTSLIAIALCAAGARRPGSIVRPGRWPLRAALVLALVQIIAAIVVFLALFRDI